MSGPSPRAAHPQATPVLVLTDDPAALLRDLTLAVARGAVDGWVYTLAEGFRDARAPWADVTGFIADADDARGVLLLELRERPSGVVLGPDHAAAAYADVVRMLWLHFGARLREVRVVGPA